MATVGPGVGPGVARIEWSASDSVEEVRRRVQQALDEHPRVEAWVDPDDTGAQRTATWSGLRREGLMRGVTVDGRRVDRVVYARLVDDVPADRPEGFRALLNAFLPRKRAISQMLVRDPDDRVLLCRLTYKSDWDLPAGRLLLTDWLPPWSGWDDALCLVFDGGRHDPSILDAVVRQEREIRDVAFCTVDQARERCADFTARRVESALANLADPPTSGPAYVESGGADPPL